MVAQAVLSKVTKGKAVQNDDAKGLSDLVYSINDCLITLTQLNYESDLHSSETLRQAVQRLPSRLLSKWAERTLVIRRTEEPNLKHLHTWLQDRVLALKVQQQSQRQSPSTKPREKPIPKDKENESMFSCLTTGEVDLPSFVTFAKRIRRKQIIEFGNAASLKHFPLRRKSSA